MSIQQHLFWWGLQVLGGVFGAWLAKQGTTIDLGLLWLWLGLSVGFLIGAIFNIPFMLYGW